MDRQSQGAAPPRLTIYSNYRIYASMKMNVDIMEAAADSASDLLKALANRHRLLIVCQLIDGERSVGDLAEFLGLRDSTVSQHLALLRKDGLVSARRDAQTIYYSIASDPARQILSALYRVYCTPPNRKTPLQGKTMRP
jgi:ArsR family transcriptional regulator, virulence genes transcriptional regulator